METEVREVFTIMKKASNRDFSWLKAPTSTFKNLLGHPIRGLPRNYEITSSSSSNTASLYRDT